MIKSESKFIWKLILTILLLPITVLLVIFRKKPSSKLVEPFSEFFEFISEAKATLILIIITSLTFIGSFFLSENMFLALASVPSDLLTFRWYSLITSGFLHADIYHLLGNMLVLFLFGRVVEKELGTKKFLLVYFLGLIISNIFSSLIHLFIVSSNIPGIGASGAIMGIVAAAFLLEPFYLTYIAVIPLPLMVVGWLYIFTDITGILSGSNEGIGHFAHLGGFLSISIILFFLEREKRQRLKKGFIINLVSLIIIAVLYLTIGQRYIAI